MQIDVNTNLCAEVVTEMERLGFSQSSVNTVKGTSQFIDGYEQNNTLQRTMLTMLFYNILISSPTPAPAHIRLALNVATDSMGWWDDMRLVILPFIKVNEEKFFAL